MIFYFLHLELSTKFVLFFCYIVTSPNSDPDPPDPHVFGPPGSGSISQRYGSGSSKSNNQKNLKIKLVYFWHLEGQ
jgi:hypothetical protein